MDSHAARRRALQKLAEKNLQLARDLYERALAAEDAATACTLIDAYVKASEGVRHAIEEDARLGRETRRARRPAPPSCEPIAPPSRLLH